MCESTIGARCVRRVCVGHHHYTITEGECLTVAQFDIGYKHTEKISWLAFSNSKVNMWVPLNFHKRNDIPIGLGLVIFLVDEIGLKNWRFRFFKFYKIVLFSYGCLFRRAFCLLFINKTLTLSL